MRSTYLPKISEVCPRVDSQGGASVLPLLPPCLPRNEWPLVCRFRRGREPGLPCGGWFSPAKAAPARRRGPRTRAEAPARRAKGAPTSRERHRPGATGPRPRAYGRLFFGKGLLSFAKGPSPFEKGPLLFGRRILLSDECPLFSGGGRAAAEDGLRRERKGPLPSVEGHPSGTKGPPPDEEGRVTDDKGGLAEGTDPRTKGNGPFPTGKGPLFDDEGPRPRSKGPPSGETVV
jgi:hypothetical protein